LCQYWSFGDKDAKDAAIRVWHYLKKYSRISLFCLENQQPTLDFASKFAQKSSLCTKRWEENERRVAQLLMDRNAEIETKRKKCKRIRDEIEDLESLKLKKRKKYSSADWNFWDAKDLLNAISNLDIQISKKESEYSNTLKPPRFVVHALPKDYQNALPVLFFLDMPDELVGFSTITMKAVTANLPWDTQKFHKKPIQL
jgi:hypothetical protein